ncbi:MAG TPA: GntR family transcriptional regulator [Acidimicrobiales bacterium]|nr:GntR family transcriptional regulator [Acidimicrobiales bacterium]
MRTLRYRAIADDVRHRIADGEYAAGQLLPSEAELSARFEVSRVTVRKALEELRGDGLVDSRQGFGWFVAVDPVSQSLGRLGTIEDQLAESGAAPVRRILEFGFVDAPERVAAVLGGTTVLRVRRVNLADGAPFARVTVWCPEDLASGLSRDDVERASFYDLVDVELGGATQTIGAGAATPDDAEVLGVPVGSPVLVCDRVTRAADGRVVLVSEHVFPAHLTQFVVDLPHVPASISPTGLRLVEEPPSVAPRPPVSSPPADAAPGPAAIPR